MKSLGELFYSREKASGEAASKVESHAPRIEAPSEVRAEEPFEVRISVGPHPSRADHSIRWVDVYVYEEGRAFNPVHAARVTLEPEYSEPEVVLRLKLRSSGRIYVLAYCNLHGVWEASKEVKVR